jgi:hypothetical protein
VASDIIARLADDAVSETPGHIPEIVSLSLWRYRTSLMQKSEMKIGEERRLAHRATPFSEKKSKNKRGGANHPHHRARGTPLTSPVVLCARAAVRCLLGVAGRRTLLLSQS